MAVKLKAPRGVARYNLFLSLLLVVLVSLIFLSHYRDGAALKQVGRTVAAAKNRVVSRPGGLLGTGLSSSLDRAGDAARAWEYRRALQHEGTGARIERFLEKARSGQPFVVSAVGGSVSKGRGLAPPEGRYSSEDAEELATLYSPENLHVVVFDWLNKTFPHPENRFVNGAQGGVGSGYFGWCFKEHIPEDSDLILVELGINDLQRLDVIPKYEHLIRSLLELDTQPAIINIETFTTLFPALISSSSLHQDVVSYYDVPSLSIRDVLLPRILADPDTQLPRWFRTGGDVVLGDGKVREWGGVPVDLMHISALGHSLAASLMITYLKEQVARTAPPIWGKPPPRPSPLLEVPATYLTSSFNPDDLPERRAPVCRSMNSPRLHDRLPGSDEQVYTGDDAPELVRGLVLAEGSHGWEKWSWHEKNYLVATEPGALAVFDFVTPEPGTSRAAREPTLLPDPEHIANRPYRRSRRGARRSRARGSRGVMRRADEDDAAASAATDAEASQPSLAPDAPPPGGDGTDVSVRGGSVSIGYQRSATFGLGSVWCWVDEARAAGRRVDGWWSMRERNMGMAGALTRSVDEIVDGLVPGRHTLQCELLADTLDPQGRREFRIFAVMHD